MLGWDWVILVQYTFSRIRHILEYIITLRSFFLVSCWILCYLSWYFFLCSVESTQKEVYYHPGSDNNPRHHRHHYWGDCGQEELIVVCVLVHRLVLCVLVAPPQTSSILLNWLLVAIFGKTKAWILSLWLPHRTWWFDMLVMLNNFILFTVHYTLISEFGCDLSFVSINIYHVLCIFWYWLIYLVIIYWDEVVHSLKLLCMCELI